MQTMTASTGRAGTARRSVFTAIDTHAHVFAPHLPLAAERRYAPHYDAPLCDYLALLDAHRVSHGVLVQPSFLGSDNRYLLAALAGERTRLRGIAVIDPAQAATDPTRLDTLAQGGIVGIRLNLFGAPDPDYAAGAWQAVLPRIAALRWQIEVHCEAGRLPRVVEPLVERRIDVVVDHFGRPDSALGVDDPGFRYLLSLGDTRRVWVKLSGAYRNGSGKVGETGEMGEAAAREAVPLLKQAFGVDRLVWGSDWPHTQFERDVRFGDTFSLIHALLPDDAERHAVLVETAARLFGFV